MWASRQRQCLNPEQHLHDVLSDWIVTLRLGWVRGTNFAISELDTTTTHDTLTRTTCILEIMHCQVQPNQPDSTTPLKTVLYMVVQFHVDLVRSTICAALTREPCFSMFPVQMLRVAQMDLHFRPQDASMSSLTVVLESL